MSKSEKAMGLFGQGYLCSQAVLVVLGEDLGIDRGQALKLATGVGAGIATRGEICGAVVGAILALGLKHGSEEPLNFQEPIQTFLLTNELIEQIKSKHGCHTCLGLTGIDFTKPEAMQRAEEDRVMEKVCLPVVKDVIETVERLW